ncbi:MAG: caspase family protein [Pseudonocardiales bacterium]|nr:caspase family protein [Pseudonocardiales bacterium]MBV9028885.1 caspase family protein [Pseudonocardiales bacterium]MBW0009533.1 caspase family protein [Pseudonocardiales bacterium]
MPRRLALLVATYHYHDVGLRRLTAPGHDAEALAKVLRDPEIADLKVTTLINEPLQVVGEAIGEFYHNRRSDDLTLLYFTGHGMKDDQGRLYLAMTNTTRDNRPNSDPRNKKTSRVASSLPETYTGTCRPTLTT